MGLFLFLFMNQAMADLSQSASKLTNTTTVQSSTDPETSKEGYYDRQTKVIGSSKEFNQRKFELNSFEPWIDLLVETKAIDKYIELVNSKKITQHGRVLVAIELDKMYNLYQKVSLENLRKYYQSSFSGAYVLGLLKQQLIIDDFGYLVGADKFKHVLDQSDFNFIETKLAELNFGLTNEKANKFLATELYRYILNESTLVVVDKLETTNYQSKKSGFFDSLVDTMAGNFVGKIFNPDKISTSKGTQIWSAQFDPYDYYKIYYGFSDYAYEATNGYVAMFGDEKLNSFSLLRHNSSTISQIGGDLSFRKAIISYNDAMVPYVKFGLGYDVLEDSSGRMSFYDLNVGGGSNSPFMMSEFNFGLAYKSGIGAEGLGFSWQFKGDIYPVNPFYLTFSTKGYLQPNFIEQKTNWSYSEFTVGLGLVFHSLAVEGGYQWNTIHEGWIGQGKLFF